MIALDIDNTLADVHGQLRPLFPGAEALELKLAHWAPVSRAWFATPAGRKALEAAEPLPRSVSGAWKLAQLGEIVYLTSRPVESAELTRRWLREHGYPPGSLVYAATPAKKAEYGRMLGVELAVDDDPAAAKAYREAGIPVLMPRHRYNAQDHAAYDWLAIPAVAKRMLVPLRAAHRTRAAEAELER